MKKQALETLEKVKNYTLQVAQTMPEDGYGFRPEGVAWNFGVLLNHLAYGIQWWEENYIHTTETDWDPPELEESKEAVLQYLQTKFQNLESTCNQLSFDDPKEMMGFFSTLDHITHHRGQAVIYLRIQGLTPPEYTY